MKNKFLTLRVFTLANFLVFALFLWQGNKGFNIADEGYLWYGAQRVMLGEVPLLDFRSYDPGRYYWSATLMSLWGDNGIMSLRWTLAIFQAIGLFVGLLLIARAEKIQNSLYLLLSSLTLVVWMYPRYKVFDISISILLIGVLTFLIQKPTRRRYFLTGLCVGLVAVFGRNHGVYGVAGSIGCIAWLSIKRSEGPGLVKSVIIWATGVLVGYMPIFFMALFVPGFAPGQIRRARLAPGLLRDAEEPAPDKRACQLLQDRAGGRQARPKGFGSAGTGRSFPMRRKGWNISRGASLYHRRI